MYFCFWIAQCQLTDALSLEYSLNFSLVKLNNCVELNICFSSEKICFVDNGRSHHSMSISCCQSGSNTLEVILGV